MAITVTIRDDRAFTLSWSEATGAIGDSVTVLPIVVSVAVLTDRKIALNLPQMEDPSSATVEDLASGGDLVVGSLDMTPFEALERLSDSTIRRLPIVDEEQGTLAGIVTLDDLIVLLTSELENAGEVIQAQSPRL